MIAPAFAAARSAPAAVRNRDPILAVLRRVLPEEGTILEVGSGTGEHVVHFARHLPNLRWQPSDPDREARDSVSAHAAHAGLANILPTLALDATEATWAVGRFRGVLCVNVIHIAPWDCCEGLLAGAAVCLDPGAPLVLYGPFSVGGRHTAPSNERFDAYLRATDPTWGVRDLDDVAAMARTRGLVLVAPHRGYDGLP